MSFDLFALFSFCPTFKCFGQKQTNNKKKVIFVANKIYCVCSLFLKIEKISIYLDFEFSSSACYENYPSTFETVGDPEKLQKI